MISDDDWEDGLKILRRYKLDDINFKIYSKSKDYDNIGYVMSQIWGDVLDKEWCIGKGINSSLWTGRMEQKSKYHLFLLEKSEDSMAFKIPIYRGVDYDKKYGWRFYKDAKFKTELALYLNHNEIALLPILRNPSFLNWDDNPLKVKQ